MAGIERQPSGSVVVSRPTRFARAERAIGTVAGLYVCEMITSRGLVERDRKTLSMLQFDPGERVRSVQLYGVDPVIMARRHRDPVQRVRR